MNLNLTILIPTKNRHKYLNRALKYYRENGFDGRIIVGDASDIDNFTRTVDVCRYWDAEYQSRDCSGPRATQFMLEYVTTPYVLNQGDDDFHPVKGLRKAQEFLDAHPDYGNCGGRALVILDNAQGIREVYPYRLSVCEEDDPVERLKNHFANYAPTALTLYRTAVAREAHKYVDVTGQAFGWELLPSALAVLSGKVGYVDALTLVRTLPPERVILPSLTESSASNEWREDYRRMVEVLGSRIGERDASETLEVYLITVLRSEVRARRDLFRTVARRIPGAIRAYCAARRYWSVGRDWQEFRKIERYV